MGLIVRGLLLGVAAVVSGCGDNTAPANAANCDTPFSACGGAIVGAWQMAAACAVGPPKCPGESIAWKGAGGVSFNADGTVSTVMANGTGTLKIPGTCLGANGTLGGTKCTDFAFGQTVCSADPGSGDCSCVGPATTPSSLFASAYSTNGGMLTLTFNDGSSGQSFYCVAGNVLRLQSVKSPAAITILTR